MVRIVAALAYVLLPISGLIAFITGGSARLRFHGAQSIVFSTLWAVGLYAASALASAATVVVAAAGTITWLLFLVGSGSGRDPALPYLGALLWRAARPPR